VTQRHAFWLASRAAVEAGVSRCSRSLNLTHPARKFESEKNRNSHLYINVLNDGKMSHRFGCI